MSTAELSGRHFSGAPVIQPDSRPGWRVPEDMLRFLRTTLVRKTLMHPSIEGEAVVEPKFQNIEDAKHMFRLEEACRL